MIPINYEINDHQNNIENDTSQQQQSCKDIICATGSAANTYEHLLSKRQQQLPHEYKQTAAHQDAAAVPQLHKNNCPARGSIIRTTKTYPNLPSKRQ
jgi:hypothetical protein